MFSFNIRQRWHFYNTYLVRHDIIYSYKIQYLRVKDTDIVLCVILLKYLM